MEEARDHHPDAHTLQTAIKAEGFRSLGDGEVCSFALIFSLVYDSIQRLIVSEQAVEFEVIPGGKGSEAANVSGPAGAAGKRLSLSILLCSTYIFKRMGSWIRMPDLTSQVFFCSNLTLYRSLSQTNVIKTF